MLSWTCAESATGKMLTTARAPYRLSQTYRSRVAKLVITFYIINSHDLCWESVKNALFLGGLLRSSGQLVLNLHLK